MKPNQFRAASLLALGLLATALWTGCASSHDRNTQSLLSAAGFRTLTPSTPNQQACFDALPPDQIERHEINGRVVYAYADKRRGLLFVGNESNYQRFRHLAFQQRIANQQLQTAQMNENAAMNWSYWGTGGMAW